MTDEESVILRLIERHPGGITQADIVLSTDLTPYAVTKAMRLLRAAKLAEPTRSGGPGLAWATPEHAPAARAAHARAMFTARSEREARRAAAALADQSRRQEKEAEEAATDSFARPSARRTVTQWERPAVSVPFSVFNQGAAS